VKAGFDTLAEFSNGVYYEIKITPHFHKKKEITVGIFRDEDFPSEFKIREEEFKNLVSILRKKANVIILNSDELNDLKVLNRIDFLFFSSPYFPIFSYSAIENFVTNGTNGGGLICVGGIPFQKPLFKKNGRWKFIKNIDVRKKFLHPLGIRYYNASTNGKISKFNNLIFKKKKKIIPSESTGLIVATGYGGKIKIPTRGNVFLERIPVRDFVPILSIYDKGNNLNFNPIILIKSWQNPYNRNNKVPRKWFLSTLDLSELKFILPELLDLVFSPLLIYDLKTNYACYRDGEDVEISFKVKNLSHNLKKCKVVIEIINEENKTIFKEIKRIKVKEEKTIKFYYSPKRFNSEVYPVRKMYHDLSQGKYISSLPDQQQLTVTPSKFSNGVYQVNAYLMENNKVIDYDRNGFVVWNDSLLNKGPNLKTLKNKFIINSKEKFIWGINYYESKLGELNWLYPNIFNIKNDFEKMEEFGIDFVRIHYHHPKWFNDYLANTNYQFKNMKVSPLPDEKYLRILDAIIILANKYKLIVCFDLFSLIPNEMGNPQGWLGGRERITDFKKIDFQKKFIKLIAKRYKNIPNITWDLWNEPRLNKEDISLLRKWTEELVKTFRENGDKHLITVGGNDSLYLSDIIDYISIHTDNLAKIEVPPTINKPILIQEFWLSADLSRDEEISQAKKLKKILTTMDRKRFAGFCPWQWTRQARLWDNIICEKWDDDLGLILREDSSLRPSAYIWKLFIPLEK
jgi:hypothetical protein